MTDEDKEYNIDELMDALLSDNDVEFYASRTAIRAEFDRLNARIVKMETLYTQGVTDFNSGYDAYKRGDPVESESSNITDEWLPGYAWAAFDDLRAKIAELEAAQRWIPCAERMPDIGIDVICTDKIGINVAVGCILCGSWSWSGHINRVDYWMPLPIPSV